MLKTFYGRKLHIFVISKSACSWQAFPAKSIVCKQGQEPTLEWRYTILERIASLQGTNTLAYYEIHNLWW
jgi:hypothetical protein